MSFALYTRTAAVTDVAIFVVGFAHVRVNVDGFVQEAGEDVAHIPTILLVFHVLCERDRVRHYGAALGDAAIRLTEPFPFVLSGTHLALFQLLRIPFGEDVVQSQYFKAPK